MPTAAELVDWEFGTIDRRIFWDQDIYERELERIFARSWLFVAHESQVQTPGSFVTTYIGEDSVIVAQGDDGINVFLNSCPHRGNRVCFADSGQGRQFTCNYHGWAFGLDGTLKRMPKMGLYTSTPAEGIEAVVGETAPFSTALTFPTQENANLGVPIPGTTIKMVPAGERYELRVRDPNVTPGYWRDVAATAAAFDDEGFYCVGDAGNFADPDDPPRASSSTGASRRMRRIKHVGRQIPNRGRAAKYGA